MRKKLISLLTAIMVLAGYSAPAFADEISVPETDQVAEITADVVSEGEDAAEAETADETADETAEVSETDEAAEISETDETAADEQAEDTAVAEDTDEQTEQSEEQPSESEPEEDQPEDIQTEDTQPEEQPADTDAIDTDAPADEAGEDAAAAEDTAEDAAEASDEEVLEEELELKDAVTYEISGIGTFYTGDNTLTINSQLPDFHQSIMTTIQTRNSLAYSVINSKGGIKHIDTTTGAIAPANCIYLFSGLTALEDVDLYYMDLSAVTTMESMFKGDTKLKKVEFGDYGSKTSKLTNIYNMFNGCSSLEEMEFDYYNRVIDFTKVTDARYAFKNCTSLERVTMPDCTMKPQYMQEMFYGCSSLKELYLYEGYNDIPRILLTNLNSADATGNMFYGCTSLEYLNLPKDFEIKENMKLPNKIGSNQGWGLYEGWVISGNGTYAEFTAPESGDYVPMKLWFTWDSYYGRLTLRNCLPSTGYKDRRDYDLAYYANMYNSNIDHNKIKSIVIESGTYTECADDMFNGLVNLTSITGLENLGVYGNMTRYMFCGCQSLEYIDISEMDVYWEGITNDNGMFARCSSLKKLKLPKGFMVKNDMGLPNVDDDYKGWAKEGTSTIVSGTGEKAQFMADSSAAATYVRVPAKLGKPSFSCYADGVNIQISWSPVNGATKYRVYRVENGTIKYLTETTKYIYTDTGLKVNTKYGYLVRAFDETTGSEYTNNDIKYATTGTISLAKPVFMPTPGAGSVTVNWQKVNNAQFYRVYRYVDGKFTCLKDVTGTSYTDTGLVGGTKYGYLVRAFYGEVGSDYTTSDIIYATPTQAPLTKPSFTVTAGNGTVTVKWTANGAQSYRIYRKAGTSVAFLKEVTSGTSYTDTGLANNVKYGYLVRAFNGNTGTNYTDADWKFATPTGSTGIAKPAFTATAGDKSVVVKWNAVSGATSYRVYRKTGTTVTPLKELTGTSYTDSGLTNGTKYGYLVRAFKGTTGSTYTDADWKFATPAASGSVAKPSFTVAAATGSVTVKWSAVSGATSYRVYTKTGSTVKMIKEVTGTSYTDTAVTNGTKTGYLVRAFKGSTGSAYTDADWKYVTPLAKPSFSVTGGTKSATIRWNKVTGAASYRVYIYQGGQFTFLTTVDDHGSNIQIDMNINSTGNIGFLVRAFNGNDASSYTNADIKYATIK